MGKKCIYLILLLALAPVPAMADSFAYALAVGASSANEDLYLVNLTNPMATLIGTTGDFAFDGMALTPNGHLYAVQSVSSGILHELDTSTGAATSIFNIGKGSVEALDAGESGIIAGEFTIGNPDFYSIDPAGSTTDIVTATTNPGGVRGAAILDADTLILSADYDETNTARTIFQLTLSTGQLNMLGQLPDDSLTYALSGIDFASDGQLYGLDTIGRVWQIDYANPSLSSVVGNTGNQLWLDMAIIPTAIPEPTSLLLFGTGLGILWLGVNRRRRK